MIFYRQFLLSICLVGLVSSSFAGTQPNYTITDIPVPPSKFATDQIDGLAFLPDGRLAVCLPSGEIFFYDVKAKKWSLFAEGLHNPLGIVAESNSSLIVSQRPEVTRVKDTDGDGKADDFEVLTDQFGMSGNYHEFHFTPVVDPKDRGIYFALGTGSSGDGVRAIVRGKFDARGRPGRMHASTPYRGCVMKLTAEGETVPWSYGHRTPNGLGFDLKGNLFVTDNQGDWVGSSKLFHVKKGRFYGHAASLTWKEGFTGTPVETSAVELAKLRTRACVVFPHGSMANSPTQVLAISSQAKFGPFTGQLLVGEMNKGRIMRVMLEEVGGELQGACAPFIDGGRLKAGCNRMAWAPDGSLYIGKTKHTWAGSQGIQRVEWDGTTPFEVQSMNLTKKGFRFTFTQAVNREAAAKIENWPFQRYYFRYHKAYGSPRFDEVAVPVSEINISEDGKVVEINLSELEAWHIHEVDIKNLVSEGGVKLTNTYYVYTLNRLLENTPPEPLQAEDGKPAKKSTKVVPAKGVKGLVLEAEDGDRKGPAIQSSNGGWSGRGYVDFGSGDQSVNWTLERKAAGKAEIFIRYALTGSERPLKVVLNGQLIETLRFPDTGSWRSWKYVSVKADLKKGKNTISLETTGNSGGNIDRLEIVDL